MTKTVFWKDLTLDQRIDLVADSLRESTSDRTDEQTDAIILRVRRYVTARPNRSKDPHFVTNVMLRETWREDHDGDTSEWDRNARASGTWLQMGHSTRHCAKCDDDGYVDVYDEDGMVLLASHDCPHLKEPWHRSFGASGIFGPSGHKDPRCERCGGTDFLGVDPDGPCAECCHDDHLDHVAHVGSRGDQDQAL